MFNAHYETIPYKLPSKKYGADWVKELDTAFPDLADEEQYEPESIVEVKSRSLVLLKCPTDKTIA